jgi:hypothetical protein
LLCWTLLGAAACGGISHRPSEGEAGSDVGGAVTLAGSSSSSGAASNPFGGSGPSGAPLPGGASGLAGSAPSSLCQDVSCDLPVCEDGSTPMVPIGLCCPVCFTPSSGCENVECEPPTACPVGYEIGQPAGACCEGCVPTPGATIACDGVVCPHSECLLGYVRGDQVGGCCNVCVPDGQFCNYSIDCVMVLPASSGCECPEAVNTRAYRADACLSLRGAARPVPPECGSPVTCDDSCGPEARQALCEQHRCTAAFKF